MRASVWYAWPLREEEVVVVYHSQRASGGSNNVDLDDCSGVLHVSFRVQMVLLTLRSNLWECVAHALFSILLFFEVSWSWGCWIVCRLVAMKRSHRRRRHLIKPPPSFLFVLFSPLNAFFVFWDFAVYVLALGGARERGREIEMLILVHLLFKWAGG